MMREYIVFHKDAPTKHWYSVSAPSKRVARYCAMNLYEHEYSGGSNDYKDWVAKRFDGNQITPIEEVF